MGILSDAVDLVCWYEDQPDLGTYKSDGDIAIALGWFLGGHRPANMASARARAKGGWGPPGDAARVRRARHYVDRNNEHQPFVGYSFGTKRNGAGRKFSLLRTPTSTHAEEAVDEAVSEQMGRAVQLAKQAASERQRMVGRLQLLEEEYVQSSRIDAAFAIHDAVRDLQTNGEITGPTLLKAARLGLLAALGVE